MPRSSFTLDAGAILVMWASFADSIMEQISMEAKQKASRHLAAKLDYLKITAAARAQLLASLDSDSEE